VTLHDVEITSANKDAYDQLQMDVTAKTYRYLDDEEIASAEAARKANTATTRGSSGA
jgi:type IV pilus assembly protein PilO